MSSKKQSASRNAQNRVANVINRHSIGIEVNAGPKSTMDVRFLCVAIHYPYMFRRALGDLTIDRNWSTAFTLTCMEIDALLGPNKRGFCWRQLDIEDGAPHWYWALGKDYDHQVLVTGLDSQASVVIAKSALDPNDELRNAIRARVEVGMRRAAFFNRDASNAGALQ